MTETHDQPRRPSERRGSSDEYGLPRDRREDERRSGQRRQAGDGVPPGAERRSGRDRRRSEQRAKQRRSGADRRSVPERLNRVASILLPGLLAPREHEEPDDSSEV